MLTSKEANIYMFDFKIAFIAPSKDYAKKELQKKLAELFPDPDSLPYFNSIENVNCWELIEARNIITGKEVTE